MASHGLIFTASLDGFEDFRAEARRRHGVLLAEHHRVNRLLLRTGLCKLAHACQVLFVVFTVIIFVIFLSLLVLAFSLFIL